LSVREAIIKSAMDIFSEKGYKGATTKEIADHAGCNEVTLFRHFGNKEALFEESLQRFTPPSIMPKALSDLVTGDVESDLGKIANEYIDAALEKLPYIRMSLIEIPRNPELARLMAVLPVSMTSNVNEYLLKMHEDGVIPKADFGLLSEIFYNMLFQYVLGAYVFAAHKRDEEDRTAYVALAARVMAAGLRG
jgi:AcrR family transcriptional regulator